MPSILGPEEVRQKAIDETKIGGQTDKALALALVYLADRIEDLASVASTLRR